MAIAVAAPLIAQTPGAAQPVPEPSAGANLPSQRIGKDDLVNVVVYGSPEMSRAVRVQENGSIRVPLTNKTIAAAGLLPSELESSVAGAIRDANLLVEPLVTVTVTEYRSRPVSVVGAVVNPQTFQAVGDMTLLEAIGRAGGPAANAGPEVLISHLGTEGTRRIPLRALIDEGKPEFNIQLHGGEQIRIPEAGKVYVIGNVKKPGIYPVSDASGTSVMRILAFSEGLSQYAGKIAYVYRKSDPAGPAAEIPIELRKVLDRKEKDVALLANDILYVPEDGKKRATFTTLEKLLLFGSASTAALIYGMGR